MKPADSRKYRSLDVRPLIARGEEPFKKIFATVASLAPGEGLALTAPFLPSPLIERLQTEGFSVRTERREDGSWQTFFSRM
ncbi:MAG: DUF2249 domain-containing protein [Verrucomicrobiota bacterium]|nr:DUF2249 domain-containing protein [Verrucomicrobiota bacterium]